MAATLVLSESNGAGEVVTDNISNLNFGSTDAPNLSPTVYPITIGLNSYQKYIRIKVTAMGGANSIFNLKTRKSAGAYVSGEGIFGNVNLSAGSYFRLGYLTPVRTVPGGWWTQTLPTTFNSDPANGSLGIDVTGTANDAGSDTVSGSITSAPNYSQYWGAQLTTDLTTPAGAGNQKTFEYRWNEE